MDLRTAQLSDLDALVQSNLSLAWETEDLKLDQKTVEAGVRAVLEDPSKGRYLVVEQNKQIIASLMITHEWSDWRNKNIAWIQSVFVQKAERKKGHFTRLFGEVEKLCQKDEYCGIRLYADKSNQSALEVYQKLGLNDDHYIFLEKMNF